jgi:hypothetical protein
MSARSATILSARATTRTHFPWHGRPARGRALARRSIGTPIESANLFAVWPAYRPRCGVPQPRPGRPCHGKTASLRRLRIPSLLALALLWLATPAFAHRLDEYLQAATLDLQKNRIAVELRLTPGVAVLGTVLPRIDTDGDSVVSEAEQRAYAQRVLGDVSFAIDGKPVPLRLVSSTFPNIEQMKEGLGDIVLNCEAQVPPGGPTRRLIFVNHHQNRIAAYLANCLFPSDPTIRITAQDRTYDQSVYQVEYTQPPVIPASPPPHASWSALRLSLWLGADALVLSAWLAMTVKRRRWRNGMPG